MASISIYRRSEKGGSLRFRISDGRGVCLYWTAPTSDDKSYQHDASYYISLLEKVYTTMRQSSTPPSSAELYLAMSQTLNVCQSPSTLTASCSSSPLVERYLAFLRESYEGGFIGERRYRQCCGKARRLQRFLLIQGRPNLRAEDFSADMLLLYRSFVFDEHLWAQRYPELYIGLRRPHKRLKANSVVNEMRALRCFFAELEDREEIRRSPFRSLPREKRRSIMREVYGTPVFLRAGEFQRLKSCTVPKSYAWVKDIFLLNCYLGCRIGDLCKIGPEKIGISSEGIEFVHYLPSKTKRKQINNQELETPLLKGASRLLHSSLAAELPQLQLRKYNSLLPKILKYAGLDRKVSVWDDGSRENVYKPLWSVATSKLARKTFVDMMCKVQINAYAAGLHSEGSGSVHRYTSLELPDRYALMRLAFGE